MAGKDSDRPTLGRVISPVKTDGGRCCGMRIFVRSWIQSSSFSYLVIPCMILSTHSGATLRLCIILLQMQGRYLRRKSEPASSFAFLWRDGLVRCDLLLLHHLDFPGGNWNEDWLSPTQANVLNLVNAFSEPRACSTSASFLSSDCYSVVVDVCFSVPWLYLSHWVVEFHQWVTARIRISGYRVSHD